MPTIHDGRWTATPTDDLVVFLIGARVNRLHAVRKVWQVASTMPRLLARLAEEPELGLLHAESFRRGRTTLSVQYWRSHEHLQRFATDPSLPHARAWQDFVRTVGFDGDVGIWHETYVVPKGNAEAIYGSMPVFGLAAATGHVPVGQMGGNARQRMAAAARA